MVQAMTSSVLTLVSMIFLYESLLASATPTYNVVSLGARGDGKTESSKAFLSAWDGACGSAYPATIYVPQGRYLIASKTIFVGNTCKNNAITVHIDGTLVAPSDYNVLGHSLNWIVFENVNGVSIYGGTLDAQGTALWACKSYGKNCPAGATTLEFSNSNNVVVSGLTSLNSQMFHIVINSCNNVKLQGVKVSAAGNSPNTDGIHVGGSSGVTILSSKIATGDDCISVGPGTTNLWVESIACGPGHGISIGSLGKDSQESGVQNVTVKTVTFTGTQNGLRIKTWAKPSNGFARGVLFQHATMVSGVKISGVTYQDIHGTSATEVAVNFDCSKQHPCSKIILKDVHLTHMNQPALASCVNAEGTSSGSVQPTSCL
ncbi:hypothetical protein HYC85_018414 [Camellia sinensis]|uniref:Polygalacturonase n=1 Tax=Camellia sinensis TaxID=4442 RepID=A0A7J7GV69_CAMSI|nr:hypothetical protein HYC85_018414 [Camellia sinensis]